MIHRIGALAVMLAVCYMIWLRSRDQARRRYDGAQRAHTLKTETGVKADGVQNDQGSGQWREDHDGFGRQAARTRPADYSVHRGRWHRAGHLARLAVRLRQRGQEIIWRQAPDRVDGGV